MKGVIIERAEIMKAFRDLLKYYETQEDNINTKAVKQALKGVLNHEENVH